MLAHDVPASMVVCCKVLSVSSLRKKGYFLVEAGNGSEGCMQIVTSRSDVMNGHHVMVALPGAELEDKTVVKCAKIGGEWSEGVLVDVVDVSSEAAKDALGHAPGDVPDQQDDSADDTAFAEFRVLQSGSLAMEASDPETAMGCVHHVNGDASKAQYARGQKIIAHVCNDMGRWGKGFVMAITDTWGKKPGKLYRRWHKAGAEEGFALGRVQLITLSDKLALANIIGQNGIKTSSKGPPVRYEAIQLGLDAVCLHAREVNASVHMPRIGSGLAGGDWARIELIVEAMAIKHAVDIYVYEYSG